MNTRFDTLTKFLAGKPPWRKSRRQLSGTHPGPTSNQQFNFDELTKGLAQAVSRRQVLQWIVGGLTGSVLVSLVGCAPPQNCRAGQTLCDGKCADTSQDPNNCGTCAKVCTASQLCVNSSCTSGQTVCFGTTTNLASDRKNCGACGTFCTEGQLCCNGKCTDPSSDSANCGVCANVCSGTLHFTCINSNCVSCPPENTFCNTGCADLMTDPKNCFACSNSCLSGEACIKGTCSPCPPNRTVCQGVCCPDGQSCCNGRCTDVATDDHNCGSCGFVCPRGEMCGAGVCICKDIYCDAICTDPKNDPQNCGMCGNDCPAFTPCCGSTCCNIFDGHHKCCFLNTTDPLNGDCSDLLVDPKNCGGCGKACRSDQTCINGKCTPCPPQALCGGQCVDLTSDPKNCGSCKNVCPAAQKFCVNGMCQQCPTGQTLCGGICCTADQNCLNGTCVCETQGKANCNGKCVDTMTDAHNCGACGGDCKTGLNFDFCVNGQCTYCPSGYGGCSGMCSGGLIHCCPFGNVDTPGACNCVTGPGCFGPVGCGHLVCP